MAGLNFPNAVTDEKDFYGRRNDLRLIEDTLLTNQNVPVLVIGERRTGKTSLLNVAVRRLQSFAGVSGVKYAYLPVEPRGITTFNAFARSILLRMSVYLWSCGPEVRPGAGQPVPEIESIEHFEAVFSSLLQYSGREVYLVCIDEFDEIVRQTRGNDLDRILGLINRLVERADLPITFFFTLTSVPDAIKEGVPSTLVAMAQVLELRPLEPEESEKLTLDVSAGRLVWTEEQISQLFRVCGGHPYFTKLVLTHLLAVCSRDDAPVKVSPPMLDEAILLALNDPRTDHVFENLYKIHFSPAEKEILLLLARRKSPLPYKDLALVGVSWVTAARRLVKRHYLVSEVGAYDFKAALMGEWLRNWIAFEEECARYSTLQKMLAIPNEIEVDVTTGQVCVLGKPVRLSAQEFAIMDFLAERAGQLVHREELVDRIWETDQGVSDQVIDTAFYRLRKKIGDQGQYIETVPGQGFKLHRAVRISGEPRRHFAALEGGAK